MVVCKCVSVNGCVSQHYMVVLHAHRKQQKVRIFAMFGLIERVPMCPMTYAFPFISCFDGW